MNQSTTLRVPLTLIIGCFILSLAIVIDAGFFNFGSRSETDSFIAAQQGLRELAVADSNVELAERINRVNEALERVELVESSSLFVLLCLSSLGIFLAVICLLAGSDRLKSDKVRATRLFRSSTHDESDSILTEVINEISGATSYIEEYYRKLKTPQIDKKSDRTNLEFGIAEAIDLSGHLRAINEELETVHDSYSNVDKLLLKLSAKCGENAHFAAATRIEWNTMGHKLRQLSEHQNKIRTLADKAVNCQAQCNEQLNKSLEFNRTYANHSENVQSNLNQLFDNTREGYRNIDEMSHYIGESKVDVDKAAGLVQGLSERAEAIVNIIDVIDDIAEQTNQLALNASIEAARAGEQGQGFAVVAGEVRNLAARSSTATRTITELLGTIQDEAELAAQLIEKSKSSVSQTHDKIRFVDQTYRESLILARHSVSGLDILLRDVTNHFQELKTIEKGNQDVKKLCHNILSLLEEHSEMGTAVNSEGNQLTVYSDRLARLLTRQFHEINHSQQLLSLTDQSIIKLKNKLSSSQGHSVKVKGYFEQIFQQTIRGEYQKSSHDANLAINIQKLKSSANSLNLLHDLSATPTGDRSTLHAKSAAHQDNENSLAALQQQAESQQTGADSETKTAV